MGEERCKNCRYWLEKYDEQGFCRRYPPVPVVDVSYSEDHEGKLAAVFSTNPDTYFPETVADEWCGEWKEKKVLDEPRED
jgi:hypothetical protein